MLYLCRDPIWLISSQNLLNVCNVFSSWVFALKLKTPRVLEFHSLVTFLLLFSLFYLFYFIYFFTGAKKLPCNHIFHTVCLRSWFQRQQTGPTCRLDVLRVPVEGTFWDVRRNRPQVCWSFRFACIIEMYFTMNNRLQGPVHEKVELFLPPNALKKNILVCIVVCWRRLVAVLLLLSTKKVTTCYFRSPHDLY